ncbi:MAG: UDP-N-acetyl-D-glucosamine 6-dehydrogenase [Holosporales bacterium]
MINLLLENKASLSVVGLGYVGLPLAVAFAEKGLSVIGFDVSKEKIKSYQNSIDVTHEVGSEKLENVKKKLHFTSDEDDLKKGMIHIVAVPTPVLDSNMPDLSLLEKASILLGRHLKKGSIVVYESTVYPGVTEDFCLPILEKTSGLKSGIDFKIGYSPERINPGDTIHRLENITKVTSGQDEESSAIIADLYGLVVKAGIHKAPSIKVAEAAKVIENAQRDINIAFMNELSLIFDKLGINTLDVLEAAGTKWNFLKFYPGLVGGHCIGVDPYYLAHLSETLGHHAQVILAGRRINDSMSKYIAKKTIKKIIYTGKPVKGSTVLVMGLTFKENCPDIRNSKVVDIINELKEYGINVLVTDPLANGHEAEKEYGIILSDEHVVENVDAIILAVAHDFYKNKSNEDFKKMLKKDSSILIDVKGSAKSLSSHFDYWSL